MSKTVIQLAIEKIEEKKVPRSEYYEACHSGYNLAIHDVIKTLIALLPTEEEVLKELKEFTRDCAENWDCDEDGHRYNTGCRMCDAKEILNKIT